VCITQGFRCIAFGDFPQRSKRSFGLPSISRLFQRILLQKGAAGVGLAANSAMVFTSMLLFIIDFIACFCY
jgi:phospholipid/cholesterol/gamma-HCH transport system permease protein